MATTLRGVKHEDQLSLVEHLDELRTRLLISLFAFVICFAVAFWQNDNVLKIVNRPFVKATSGQKKGGALAKTQTFNRLLGIYARRTGDFASAAAHYRTTCHGLFWEVTLSRVIASGVQLKCCV